ncbi:MAG TPA: hypothetical protein VJK30_07590 [Coxiellaceae bacterium]|nr:MAG: hypothetical protein A3E81_07440 [Gammaproteobacteria bacterium RIFCSPHIGHO2_12_FULL_36_30]HLB57171.1 hypothetical protein [Coxiellaceae bacterium]
MRPHDNKILPKNNSVLPNLNPSYTANLFQPHNHPRDRSGAVAPQPENIPPENFQTPLPARS